VIEPEPEADGSRPDREVLTEAMRRLGAPRESEVALADSLTGWRPFPEVPQALRDVRERGWKLAILSNTDRDYIDASMQRIGVPFEEAIVASESGAYKPAPGHWRAFEERVGRPPGRQVAATPLPDVA